MSSPFGFTIASVRQSASVLARQSLIYQLKQLHLPEFDQRFAIDEETWGFVYTEHAPIFCVPLNIL